MYTRYFGLNEKPFNLTPDPKFLYLGACHKESYAQLLYSVKEHVGFMALVGEVGTGKTTICRSFLGQLPETCSVAFIFNPNLDDIELLKSFNKELGIEYRLASKKALQDVLFAYLLERRKAGGQVILVVDEAQNLSPSVLEQVRLLSNLETDTEKLLQIILVGQPELALMLENESLRQLKQRISVWSRLFPLDYEETARYVNHRLRTAGAARPEMFNRGAFKEIYRFSKGVPRLINVVCDRALLAAYAGGHKQVTAGILRKCTAELGGKPARHGWVTKLTSALAAGLAMGAIAALTASGAFSGVFTAEAKSGKEARNAVQPSAPQTVAAGAPVAPLAPATLPSSTARVLDKIDEFTGDAARAAAAERVLARWEEQEPLSIGEKELDYPRLAKKRGLKCFTAHMDLTQLRAINYPAVLEVSDGKNTGLMPLVIIMGDEYYSQTPGGAYATREWMEKHWTGKVHIFWKDHEQLPEMLKRGNKGGAVVWLQQSLSRLGYIADANGITGGYGPKTERSVLIFQTDNRLPADGQVGDTTKMLIYGLLPEYKTPHISLS
ncbi:MAG: AAA family ATPase [Nitrospinae bacterium]|nr:AAA family ATPase [Nitrospinota bacterium]